MANNEGWFTVEGVTVWGGVGSVAANTQDLEGASARISVVTEHLVSAGYYLDVARQQLADRWRAEALAVERANMLSWSTSADPISGAAPVLQFPTYEQELLRRNLAEQSQALEQRLRGLRETLAGLAAKVFRSAQIYSEANAEATSWWREPIAAFANPGPLNALGVLTPAFWGLKFGAGVWGSEHGSVRERLLGGATAAMNMGGLDGSQSNIGAVAGNLNSATSVGFAAWVALQSKGRTKWDLTPGNLAEHKLEIPPISKIDDMFGAVVTAREEHDGQVMVQKQVAADGTKTWVIFIPGTQEWDANGQSHPIDLSGNLGIMAGQDTQALQYVRAAMEQAGIGPNEAVTLMGHSQGGIIANALQTDPWVQARFNIAGVVTVCSPVGLQKTNPKVPTLHVENSRDFVPELDTRANPDSLNRVTLRAEITGDGAQHSFEQNGQILKHPAVLADISATTVMADINANLVAAPGATVTTTAYEATS